MSFLADFEPALIHSPFDRHQRQATGSKNPSTDLFTFRYKLSVKVNPKLSTISSISSLATPEIKKANCTSSLPLKKMPTMNISSSPAPLSSTQQVRYDRKYWTDKLVTFILMMPY
ncbi:495_t:CDS:1 [Funneliformis geosporum]|uniref:16839_t:CDS:1 n=1 Tax=Funneliformis geosporum TaxID=1117311 RepID=A0A9W4SWD7_9GLOM|nr:16839_t:CDS:1 [Funneliformis geosporum]CAI2185637.1 495_t:CDS:1 [Funneliformis geosporum]